MDKNEIENLIDQKIKSHEIRVGWISGIIGFFFTFGIVHSIWLMKKIIELRG
jgi:uncharacterized membrane protein